MATLTSITDATHAAEARRQAAAYGEEARLGERQGALAIAVTEIATNVLKHAGIGVIMLESVGSNGNRGVRVLGLDKGPGIPDVTTALQDGYSTAGTAGNGLGAVRRLAQEFDIYTAPELGTAILAEFWPTMPDSRTHTLPLDVGVLSLPIKGEKICGDGWGVTQSEDGMRFMVVDGSGHGEFAAEAAREAEKLFAASGNDSLSKLLQDCHDSLRKTRGAAMAVASLQLKRNILSFAGIGNIGASIATPTSSRGLVSHHGIVGHQVSRIQEFTFPWSSDGTLIMHSDGLKTAWNLGRYPGIWNKHPALIAGVLYRDFTRERDDVTILVAKKQS